MLVDLIKKSFELWCKWRWLKAIGREADKYEKLNQKAMCHAHNVHQLIKRYNELYPDDKISTNKEEL